MNFRENRKAVGISITLIAGVFWGLSGACGQYLFDYKGVTSGWLVPVRLLAAGVMILLYLFVRNPGLVFQPWKNRQDAGDIVIFALLGMALCQYSYFRSVEASNAGIATVLQYLGPAMILIYICMRERRRPRAYESGALFLSLAGIFVLATHGNPTTLVMTSSALFWGVVSAVTLAIYTVQPARLIDKYGSLLTTGWGMLLGGMAMALLCRPKLTEGIRFDAGMILATIGVIMLGTLAGFTMYLKGMQLLGATDASMIACIEPVSAVFFSCVWLGERFLPVDFAGMALIVGAVLVISFLKKGAAQETERGAAEARNRGKQADGAATPAAKSRQDRVPANADSVLTDRDIAGHA